MLSATQGCRADLATTLADALRRAEHEEAPPAVDEEDGVGGVLEEHEVLALHTRKHACTQARVICTLAHLLLLT
jgi:hypothetical protein